MNFKSTSSEDYSQKIIHEEPGINYKLKSDDSAAGKRTISISPLQTLHSSSSAAGSPENGAFRVKWKILKQKEEFQAVSLK